MSIAVISAEFGNPNDQKIINDALIGQKQEFKDLDDNNLIQ